MATYLTDRFRRAIQYDSHHCILFAGAGLSVRGVRKGGIGLPDWGVLTRQMIGDLKDSDLVNASTLSRLEDWQEKKEYLRVAGLFVKHTPPQQFSEFLRDLLDPGDLVSSRLHKLILRANFRGIITTNFDRVFEAQTTSLSPLIYPTCLNDIDGFRSDSFFAKIHGCVSQAYDPDNLVLTEKNYADLRFNTKYQAILNTLHCGYPFLTVGFSLTDPDFLGLLDDFRDIFGIRSPFVYALMREDEASRRSDLKDKNVQFLTYKDHDELPTIFEDMRDLRPPKTMVRHMKTPRFASLLPTTPDTAAKASRAQERKFLRATLQKPLKVGRLNLECQLFPEELWNASRGWHLYRDDPEAERQIVLNWVESRLPEDTLSHLVDQIRIRLESTKTGSLAISRRESGLLKEVYRRLTKEGSNAYPRVVALPKIVGDSVKGEPSVLNVGIGPSRYGVALVEERKLQLPTALQLRKSYVLNSLAVRVAYVYERKGEKWLEFHQRKGGANATYKNAWDVGAAGYVDPSRHGDPDVRGRVSPWLACAFELSEELGIPTFQLPHRDHYQFLGLGRNFPTGQLDLLAFCEAVVPPDVSRPPTARVMKFGRCRLNPESVASFVLSRRHWVPTALLTLLLTLEAYEYPRIRIHKAFSPLAGRLHLEP
jgi:hypothetical protein